MADDHQPTMGELYRLLQTVQTSVDRMSASADRDRENNARTFVRQDVLGPTLTTIGNRINETNTDVTNLERSTKEQFKKIDERHDSQQAKNRQYVLALIGIAGTAIVSIMMWIISGQGGVS